MNRETARQWAQKLHPFCDSTEVLPIATSFLWYIEVAYIEYDGSVKFYALNTEQECQAAYSLLSS